MREYRRTRNGIALFLALYFAGGMLALLRPDQEVFPVYSWFLFARVPNERWQYGLLLEEVGGHELESARLYHDAVGAVYAPHSVTVHKLTQRLGAALERNDSEEVARARELLEKNWLPRPARYSVVKLNADPIARWKSGRYEMQPLASFAAPPP